MSNPRSWKDKLLKWSPCTSTLVASEDWADETDESIKSVVTMPTYRDIPNTFCLGSVYSYEDEMDESLNRISHVPIKILDHIFDLLNYGDLLNCRLVEKSWNDYITNWEKFLTSTVYCLTTDPEVGLKIFGTHTPYCNTKFSRIDYDVYLKRNDFDELYSENYYFHPSPRYLENIQQLEFKYSYLTWETLKRILTATINLEHLILNQCSLCEDETVPSYCKNPSASFKQVLRGLKKFTINEELDMNMINKVLNKLLSFSSRSLESLDVQYKPASPEFVVSDEDTMTFCHSLLFILQVNTPTIKFINFQLNDETLLNRFPPLLAKLESFWKKLKLKVFRLNASGSVKITQDVFETAKIFTRFLRTQVALTDVALPQIKFSDDAEELTRSFVDGIISALPPTVKKLSVPSADYTRYEMIMNKLGPLNSLSIGEGGYSSTSLFQNHSIESNKDVADEDAFPTWKNMKQLGLGIPGISYYSNCTFEKFILMFPQLTMLTISNPDMLIHDFDLQVIIRFLSGLRSLSIAKADEITDFGLTGVPREVCERIAQTETHIIVKDTVFTESVLGKGKPLSCLQGLRHLSLKGSSNVTDFGIHFGIRFLELKNIHLPWCKKVTDWGIKRLGENNPSLEKITLCGVNKRSFEGFIHLKKNQPRLKRKLCQHGMFHQTSPKLPTLITMIPSPDNWSFY